MTISRATMKQQLKGNRMPKYKTKKGTIKTVKPIPKAAQSLLGMKNVKKKASGGKMKKKPVTKAFMGLLTSKPSLKFMKDKGIMGGGLMGLGPLAAKALKKKKRGAASPAGAAASPQAPQGMTATPMAAATPLMGGGMVKRKRSIDGIAQRGKTRAK